MVSTETDFLIPYLWYDIVVKTKISMWAIGPKFSYMPGIELVLTIVVFIFVFSNKDF